ncbi:MAG: hypothetical protein WD066_19230 [Planctomycetaceae bacterium]
MYEFVSEFEGGNPELSVNEMVGTLNKAYSSPQALPKVIPNPSWDDLLASETPGGTMQDGATGTAPDTAANAWQESLLAQDGTLSLYAHAGNTSGPASFSTGLNASHVMRVKVVSLPSGVIDGHELDVRCKIRREVTVNAIAVSNRPFSKETSIGISVGVFEVSSPLSNATMSIAGAHYDIKTRVPGGTWEPGGENFLPGHLVRAEGDSAPGEMVEHSGAAVTTVSAWTTTVGGAPLEVKFAISCGARRELETVFGGGAAVYAHAARPRWEDLDIKITSAP